MKKNLLWLMLLLFISAIVISSTAWPAVEEPTSPVIRKKIERLLSKGESLKSFYKIITNEYGQQAVQPLLELVHDESVRDEIRWASLFGVAKLTGKESLGVVRKFMGHQSWMLRDAALKTAAALNATELRTEIESKLKDEALIIRTTAVDTIGHLNLHQSAPKLVESLFDPANYNGPKALWIHSHIFTVLKEFRYRNAVPRLVQLLEQKTDSEFQGQIIATLEDLTGLSFANKPIKEQIYLWKRNTISERTF